MWSLTKGVCRSVAGGLWAAGKPSAFPGDRNGLSACLRAVSRTWLFHSPTVPCIQWREASKGHCFAWLTLQFLLKGLTAKLHFTFSRLQPRVNITGCVPCELNRKPAWSTPPAHGLLWASASWAWEAKGWDCAGTLPARSCRAWLQQWYPPSNLHRCRRATSPVFQNYIHFYHLVIFSGDKYSFSINSW